MLAINVMLFVVVLTTIVGLLVGTVLLVVGVLYIAPYSCWLGWNGEKYPEQLPRDVPLRKTFHYATVLYKHWIFRTELKF